MQAHGNKTAYAFMLDADFEVKDAWRLRVTVQRMMAECRDRSVVECPKGIKVRCTTLDPYCISMCVGAGRWEASRTGRMQSLCIDRLPCQMCQR